MRLNRLRDLLLLSSVVILPACSNTKAKVSILETNVDAPRATPVTIPLPVHKFVPLNHSVKPIPLEKISLKQISYFEEPLAIESFKTSVVLETEEPKISMYDESASLLLEVEENIESQAKRLLGKRYVWGATGPRTYDCSGFTQKIYRDAGIKIPRVSRAQAKVGEYVNYQNLRKGDMVFFDTTKRKIGRVTHVGIYLGEGNFIHASSRAKKVVICNFNKKCFYKKRFLWGRRVIKPKQYVATL